MPVSSISYEDAATDLGVDQKTIEDILNGRKYPDFELIKKQGGWKSDATVWEYIEEGQQFNNNASLVLMEKLEALVGNV